MTKVEAIKKVNNMIKYTAYFKHSTDQSEFTTFKSDELFIVCFNKPPVEVYVTDIHSAELVDEGDWLAEIVLKDKEDKEYKGTLSVDKSLGWDLLSDECI